MIQKFLFATLLLTIPLLAHHAFEAEFDGTKPVKIEGTVVKMEWINPHTWLHIEVMGTDGKKETWMIEGGSPNIMIRRGFSKASLEKGTFLQVEGFRARNGRTMASGRSITFKDGTRLFTGGSADGRQDKSK